MRPDPNKGSSETPAEFLHNAFRRGSWGGFPKLAAAITAMLGLTCLIGWVFSVPLLKSILPAAVEMKANTAVGLVLSACALFILSNRPALRQQRFAQLLALVVTALGLATLGEYLFDWKLGIDELLFRDTANAYNVIRGRMSPYTAVTFVFLGLALIVLPRHVLRPMVWLLSIMVIMVGGVSFLGYLWNARELVTDRWLPPVAVNTAFAFILLGAGTFRASFGSERLRLASTPVEVKILAGFISAFLLLILVGGYTYRTETKFLDSAKLVNHTQQVRTELGQLYGSILDVESAQRNYLLTGNQSYKTELMLSIAVTNGHKKKLLQLITDNPEQLKNLEALEPLIEHRIKSLEQHIGTFEKQGYMAARMAISKSNSIQTMHAIRNLVKRMDEVEIGLLSSREKTLAHNRELTLGALLATLVGAMGVLATLFLGIRREIMARSQAEEMSRKAKEKAEMANRAKDSFLATMSHEIRTPLTGILGMMELLSLTKLDNAQRATLDTAWGSGNALLRIVSDILDWSKIEEGKLELSPRPTSISNLLQGVVNTYSRVASTKSLLLRQQCDDRISKAHVVDELRLSQILNNFVSNAIKFTQNGTIELNAELLEKSGSSERIRFTVRDTGIGIDKEVQKNLFQRYRQESADTARMYGGTGLGLAICRHLVDMLNGQIELVSEPGQGSTFSITLTLPVTDELEEVVHNQHPDMEQITLRPLLDSTAETPLVLAVDDHPSNRDVLSHQLELLGLRAETAENGKKALSMWRGGRFSLIITDCHMPDMDGYELARAIRKIEVEEGRAHTLIIAWTANALAEEEKNCHDAGMNEVLVKPATLMQLRSMLAKCLPSAMTDIQQSSPQELISIDYAVLQEIASGRIAQIKVLRDFQMHIRVDRAKLQETLEQGDQDSAQRTAHRMKGSSRMVGAIYLAKACAAIEQAARDVNLAETKARTAALDESIQQFDTYLADLEKSDGQD